jgi:hypothetical protein
MMHLAPRPLALAQLVGALVPIFQLGLRRHAAQPAIHQSGAFVLKLYAVEILSFHRRLPQAANGWLSVDIHAPG